MKRGKKGKIARRTFRLSPEIDHWLKRASKKTGKTMTRLLEESILVRMLMKESFFLEQIRQTKGAGE